MQENQAAGGRGRIREQIGDRLRADSCGRARRSPVPVRDLDSHSRSSDDLLVDNEDAKQGKDWLILALQLEKARYPNHYWSV